MNLSPELVDKFVVCLRHRALALTASNSINIHVDELTDDELAPEVQIDWSIGLFERLIANPIDAVAGRVAMLMIPLRSSDDISLDSPHWQELSKQLSATPPSIYLFELAAHVAFDPSIRFLRPIVTPLDHHSNTSSYYQCWRRQDDDEEEGWTRQVRVEFTGFLKSPT